MQVEIKIDSSAEEPKVIIVTNRVTDEISELVNRLSSESAQIIAGFRESEAVLLDQAEIVRIYAADGKVYATANGGDYQLRLRLYECETRLDRRRFVRISNSEIINLEKVREFDLSFAGTIRVTLSDGTTTYVSRRYVSKIKQVLGM